MQDQPVFLKGVIEGFYGRPWSNETRLAYATYLPKLGLNTYIYCPKADPYLRKLWHRPWPEPTLRQLKRLAHSYQAQSLLFGVGLSPFALYENYSQPQRDLLQRKIEEINGLEAPLLAVLFDDMPGDVAQLAERQGEIVYDISRWTNSPRVLVCPTYYSFDPVLPKYFGDMPSGYWSELGRALPSGTEILWTGEKVCSESVTVSDIDAAKEKLGLPIVLWDNYPVNDGAIRSNYLFGDRLKDRDSELSTVLGGHLCNPMNQALLSLRALMGLSDLYSSDSVSEAWLQEVWGSPLYSQLTADLDEFRSGGLEGLGEQRRTELARLYRRIGGPAADEVEQWLDGEYRFDPACLTD